MEIAILIFFLAIFGGILFSVALVWFIYRRLKNSRPVKRNFSGNPNYRQSNLSSDDDEFYTDINDTSAHNYAHNLAHNFAQNHQTYESSPVNVDQTYENAPSTATAQDSPIQADNSYSHESHGASAAPSYTESSYSSYDSGSSYDSSSSSSYDSGSSSSDSGSSSSSSD